MEINNVNRAGFAVNAAATVVSEEKKSGREPAKVDLVTGADCSRRAAEDSYTASGYVADAGEVGYKQPKRLSAEQIQAMKDQLHESMRSLARRILGLQVEKVSGMSTEELTDALGLGRTPEEAAAAISEDGMWGVKAVATRLMDMALALSDGDSSKAQVLRDAVRKGFEAVGIIDELPQVCQDTYAETMTRFDYWEANGTMDGYVME